MNYPDKDSAKVHDDEKPKDTAVLEWGKIFQTKAFIQDAVITQKKTKLLALIEAESHENSDLERLVTEWNSCRTEKDCMSAGGKAPAETAAE